MRTKTMKILTTIATVMLIIAMGTTSIYAAINIGGVDISPDTNNTTNVTAVGNKIMGIIQVVGILAAVIILMILGIKYMMGSASEKAEYKKTMIPYIIGAMLIFAASTIANVIYNFMTSI